MSTNDQIINELLEEEIRKIPVFFKLSKLTAKICVAAIGAFFLLSMTFIVFFYRSGTQEFVQYAEGTDPLSINVYNGVFLRYAGVCLAAIVVIAFWLFMVQYYEKRAYAKASDFANKMHFEELRKHERALNEEKFAFRPTMKVSGDTFWTANKVGK